MTGMLVFDRDGDQWFLSEGNKWKMPEGHKGLMYLTRTELEKQFGPLRVYIEYTGEWSSVAQFGVFDSQGELDITYSDRKDAERFADPSVGDTIKSRVISTHNSPWTDV